MIDTATLPTIPAERVVLRWLTGDDVPALYEIFSHPEVMRYWSSPQHQSMTETQHMLERIHESFHKHELYQWGVARKTDNRVIGTCTLAQIDTQNRRAEIGYILAREYWGQGMMREALTALCNFAFTTMNLNRIEADVDPRNAASLRILDRLGFQREGLFRERWIVGDEIQDSAMLGLLRREWHAQST